MTSQKLIPAQYRGISSMGCQRIPADGTAYAQVGRAYRAYQQQRQTSANEMESPRYGLGIGEIERRAAAAAAAGPVWRKKLAVALELAEAEGRADLVAAIKADLAGGAQ